MRPKGGGLALLAIAIAVAVSGCVSAPSRPLRVIPGGLGSQPGMPPSPSPTRSVTPEPPIGVIFAGRVVLPCERGPRCDTYARLVPRDAPAEAAAAAASAGIAAPAATPLPLATVPTGRGPTARAGRALDHEPAGRRLELVPGDWRLEVYAHVRSSARGRAPVKSAGMLACALDFQVAPGDAFGVAVSFVRGSSCRIQLTPASFSVR